MVVQRGTVKGNSWFLSSHSWMVAVVPSNKIAKTKKGEFGGQVGCDFFRPESEIPLSRGSFMGARLMQLHREPPLL